MLHSFCIGYRIPPAGRLEVPFPLNPGSLSSARFVQRLSLPPGTTRTPPPGHFNLLYRTIGPETKSSCC